MAMVPAVISILHTRIFRILSKSPNKSGRCFIYRDFGVPNVNHLIIIASESMMVVGNICSTPHGGLTQRNATISVEQIIQLIALMLLNICVTRSGFFFNRTRFLMGVKHN